MRHKVFHYAKPNTPMRFPGGVVPDVLEDCVLINCAVPEGVKVKHCMVHQCIYYVEQVDIDGKVVTLQEVKARRLGKTASDANLFQARSLLPVGAVELDETMFAQWRTRREIKVKEVRVA